jgi:hypothetical protein
LGWREGLAINTVLGRGLINMGVQVKKKKVPEINGKSFPNKHSQLVRCSRAADRRYIW